MLFRKIYIVIHTHIHTMTKRVTISMPDYIFDMYIPKDCTNISQLMQKYITIAGQSEIGNYGKLRDRLIKTGERVLELEKENRELKLQLGSLKAKIQKSKQDEGWTYVQG